MGFLAPKPPPAAKIDPIAAPSSDDQRVKAAATRTRDRSLARRDAADTIASGSIRRRPGGLASAIRETVGG